jgi:hypothetical protein
MSHGSASGTVFFGESSVDRQSSAYATTRATVV